MAEQIFAILKKTKSKAKTEELTQALAKISDPKELDAKDSQGRTALYIAVRDNDIDSCQALIKAGAKVNVKFPWGTVLTCALFYNYTAIARDLIAAKADPNIQKDDGWDNETALFDVVHRHHSNYGSVNKPEIEFFEYLLQQGANPNIKNLYDKTPLDYACFYAMNRISLVCLLLEYGSEFGEKKLTYYLERTCKYFPDSHAEIQFCYGFMAEKKLDYANAIKHYEAGKTFSLANKHLLKLRAPQQASVTEITSGPTIWAEMRAQLLKVAEDQGDKVLLSPTSSLKMG